MSRTCPACGPSYALSDEVEFDRLVFRVKGDCLPYVCGNCHGMWFGYFRGDGPQRLVALTMDRQWAYPTSALKPWEEVE